MTAREAKRQFIMDVYGGDMNRYKAERRADYCKVQFEWTCYMDGLCKDGIISERVWDNATF